MKQELPIAITLLALGCMLWLWQSSSPNTANAARQLNGAASDYAAATNDLQSFASSPALPANVSAAAVMNQIADEFENGSSRMGDLEIKCRLNEITLGFQGRFWEQGLQSRKSRIEMVTEGSLGKVTHVCDGRFLYKLIEKHDQRELRFVNLQQLNTDDARLILATLPGSWIGYGSIATMLRTVGEAFELKQVQPAEGSGMAIQFEGTWNPDHLAKLMLNHVDHREIIPDPDWSKVPKQFPHGVRIQIARLNQSLQPTAIQFFRFDENEGSEKQKKQSLKNMLTLQFGPIQQRALSKDLFQMDSNETGAIDETQIYRERIEMLSGKNRIAEDTSSKIR